MGGIWNYYRSRHVQCPKCDHDYWSQVRTTMCSVCTMRFEGDENQFKTLEIIQKDRKQMYDELSQMKGSMKTLLEKIEKMQFQLKPFTLKEKKLESSEELTSQSTELVN